MQMLWSLFSFKVKMLWTPFSRCSIVFVSEEVLYIFERDWIENDPRCFGGDQ